MSRFDEIAANPYEPPQCLDYCGHHSRSPKVEIPDIIVVGCFIGELSLIGFCVIWDLVAQLM